LAYRDQQPGNEAAGYVLTYLANMEEEGVVILPTHRLVRGPLGLDAAALEARLGESFVLEALDPRRRRVAGEIDCVLAARRLRLRAGPAARERLRGLPPVLRGLEVELLRRAILEPILDVRPEALYFTHDADEAVAAGDAVASRARLSYGFDKQRTNDTRGLIRYLRRPRNATPSEMVDRRFHCAMPVFVARQWIRTRTASVNEYGGRYSLLPLLVYRP